MTRLLYILLLGILSVSCSCSKKVIEKEDLTVNQSSSHTISDSLFFSNSTTDFSSVIKDCDIWWNATWNKKIYEYDSLGNRLLKSEEIMDFTGGEHINDSSTHQSISDTELVVTHNDTIRDTLFINHTYYKEKSNNKVPFITRITSYIGYISLFVSLLFLLYYHRRKKKV